MTKASVAAKEHAIQTKGLSGTTDTFVAKQKVVQTELEATATSSRLASVGVKALSTAFNMFAGMAIMWGITKIIEGFEYLSESAERAKEKLSEIQTELNDNNSTYQSNRSTLVGLKEEYDALTKKAEALGGAQNLANDEYERYQAITSQILGITPKLTTGWNEEGEAISNKNNLLQASIDLLDEEYEKSLRNNTTKSKNEDVASGVIAKLDEFNNSVDTTTKSGTMADMRESFLNELEKLETELGMTEHDIVEKMWVYFDPDADPNDFWSDHVDTYEELRDLIAKDYDKLGNSFVDENNPIYELFSDEVIDDMIRNADAYFYEGQRILNDREALYQDYKDQLNWNAQATRDKSGNNAYQQLTDNGKAFINEYIEGLDYASIKTEEDFVEMANDIQKFTKLLASNEDVSKLVENIFTPATENETSAQYVERVQKAIVDVQQYCKDNYIDLPINFTTLDDVDRMTEGVQAFLSDEFDNKVGELSLGDLQIASELEVDPSTLLSWNELLTRIQKVKDEELKLKELNPVTSLASAKQAISNLNSIYEEIINGDTVSADSLASLTDDFGEVNGGIPLANFKDILTTTDDIEAQTEALDDLITQYLDSTKLIQNLEEKNKDYVKSELEKMGIVNADEFVESRLNDTTKELLENFQKFSTVYNKNADSLKNASKGSEEYEKSLTNIKDGLNDLIKSSFGEEEISFEISDDFVIDNLEDIEEASAGSTEALNRLRVELAKRYVANVDINAPSTSEQEAIRNQINGWIDGIDLDTLEVGTSLNDTPLIQGLNNLVNAGKITRDSMNSLLASIGVTPEISYKNASIKLPETNDPATRALLAGLNTATIGVPEINYKVTSSASKAKYSPSSSSSSSGGGGGSGGGSSSEEDTTETYDHIETAITRTEEAVDRLDKVVGNTYENWTKRNGALSSEINKVKDEIALQQKAYEAYMAKANSIGLSEDYKKKVQSGAIQIEDIKDEALQEKIENYKTWYEKALACSDAIQELNINLGDLAQQKFDNLEKEFSDLIDIIESKADIIEERINRTEEQGYFASASYYKQQLQYEKQTMDNLRNEYANLISQRDSAVANGDITKDSEAYQEMTQNILDVQKAMEESATATVELNNAIRDLNWEIFDYIEERISKIADESNFLIDLLDNSSLYEENGKFNENGEAVAYLHGKNYETYVQQAKDYASELKKVNADLAKDPSNKDLIERREELLELQQESISNIYAEKEAVKSLVEEGINKHLESLSELIEKYKESMNSAKDLFEYQQNISQQTEEISRLQKILKSYEGDDSEEARKSIQDYQNQLKEAEENLKETEWEKYISESEDLLNDLYDDYSETLNARLDNIDALFADIINDVNSNATTINDTINSVAKSVGYNITLLDQTAKDIKSAITAKTTEAVDLPDTTINIDVYTGSSSAAATSGTIVTGTLSNSSWSLGGGDKPTIDISKLNKYASGSKSIDKDQLALVAEQGQELKLNANTGNLELLGEGDMIFTNEMSQRLWEMAQGNMPSLNTSYKIPDISTNAVRSVNNQNAISITLPNVSNYNDFKNELQKDPKFIGFMQEATLGQALGNNKLNKNRY